MTPLFANPALPGLLNSLAHPKSRAIGSLGEQLCYHLLASRGYLPSNVHPKEHRGDLRVVTSSGEILRVEVKTARRASDGRYHFTLRKAGHTDHSDSDVIILLCAMKTGYVVPFVVPTRVVVRQNAIVISRDPYTYAGKFARYRQKMHLLNLEVLS